MGNPPTGQQEFPVTGASQQAPPQVSVVQVAWQAPPTQLPDGHTVPQAPQWDGSFRRSTHTPPQLVNPVAQVSWHWPDTHSWPAGQACPQVPQFRSSVERSVHTSEAVPALQVVFGGRHWQEDAEQTRAGVQTTPHPPQLAPLAEVSTHVPEEVGGQSATGGGLHAQEPALQVPMPQAWPQVPQLAGSVWRSTHWTPQGLVPAGHAQTPFVQGAPAKQATLQPPQWSGSEAGSMHCPSQASCPAGQEIPEDVHAAPATRSSAGTTHRNHANRTGIGRLPGMSTASTRSLDVSTSRRCGPTGTGAREGRRAATSRARRREGQPACAAPIRSSHG